MGFLSKVCLFLGYLLLYAAIADHGRYATEPWAGLLADAYRPMPAGAQGPVGPSGAPA